MKILYRQYHVGCIGVFKVAGLSKDFIIKAQVGSRHGGGDQAGATAFPARVMKLKSH
jgi:hypothetical protein